MDRNSNFYKAIEKGIIFPKSEQLRSLEQAEHEFSKEYENNLRKAKISSEGRLRGSFRLGFRLSTIAASAVLITGLLTVASNDASRQALYRIFVRDEKEIFIKDDSSLTEETTSAYPTTAFVNGTMVTIVTAPATDNAASQSGTRQTALSDGGYTPPSPTSLKPSEGTSTKPAVTTVTSGKPTGSKPVTTKPTGHKPPVTTKVTRKTTANLDHVIVIRPKTTTRPPKPTAPPNTAPPTTAKPMTTTSFWDASVTPTDPTTAAKPQTTTRRRTTRPVTSFPNPGGPYTTGGGPTMLSTQPIVTSVSFVVVTGSSEQGSVPTTTTTTTTTTTATVFYPDENELAGYALRKTYTTIRL